MSAPLSERTKAILQAVQRYPVGATVGDVVEWLRLTHPYAEWRSLTLSATEPPPSAATSDASPTKAASSASRTASSGPHGIPSLDVDEGPGNR
ncbi:MAG: hypothetical protein WKF76_02210 [Nocardioidaceae bacterium]